MVTLIVIAVLSSIVAIILGRKVLVIWGSTKSELNTFYVRTFLGSAISLAIWLVVYALMWRTMYLTGETFENVVIRVKENREQLDKLNKR